MPLLTVVRPDVSKKTLAVIPFQYTEELCSMDCSK